MFFSKLFADDYFYLSTDYTSLDSSLFGFILYFFFSDLFVTKCWLNLWLSTLFSFFFLDLSFRSQRKETAKILFPRKLVSFFSCLSLKLSYLIMKNIEISKRNIKNTTQANLKGQISIRSSNKTFFQDIDFFKQRKLSKQI